MEVQMHVYHCTNPEENPLPFWLTGKNKTTNPSFGDMEAERVEQFKKCPDSFFPEFYSKKK